MGDVYCYNMQDLDILVEHYVCSILIHSRNFPTFLFFSRSLSCSLSLSTCCPSSESVACNTTTNPSFTRCDANQDHMPISRSFPSGFHPHTTISSWKYCDFKIDILKGSRPHPHTSTGTTGRGKYPSKCTPSGICRAKKPYCIGILKDTQFTRI